MRDSSSPEDAGPDATRILGIYSQTYNEIVKPDQIWPVSKYFLRRWLPYLTPTRFWAVVAARQLAYRLGNKHRFECYDSLLYKEACTSRANFYRIKAEMDQTDTAVSLFISREPTTYQRDGDVTRPGPTVYHVRLDDVLTPGDAAHLTAWLQAQQVERRPEAVLHLLQTAVTQPAATFLAPSLTPYLADPPARFQAVTVADVVERVFGSKIGQETAVRKAADALHTHLTGATYIGTHYFRHHWLDQLGAGPALLITYLRSYCYFNEETGEIRDRVTITRPQLADALGIDRTTLFRWLKKIDKATLPDQPFHPFLELLNTQKTADNDVESTFRVQLYEPLIPRHLDQYQERVQVYQAAVRQNETHTDGSGTQSALQNETHATGRKDGSALQNETNTLVAKPEGALHNETDTPTTSAPSARQNETHRPGNQAIMDPHPGSPMQNETGIVAEVDAYKYLNTLLQALEKNGIRTFAAAAAVYPHLATGWQLTGGKALGTFAATAVATVAEFCQAVAIQGRSSRDKVASSSLSLTQLVAWYLYLLTQERLLPDARPGYLINRAQEGEPPPPPFYQLATLSWELWRCYACLLELPGHYHGYLRDAPGYELWQQQYGHLRADELPLGVGQGVSEYVTFMLDGPPTAAPPTAGPAGGGGQRAQPEAADDNGRVLSLTLPSHQDQCHWQAVLGELELQMTRATFNAWLKDARLLGRDDAVYVIGVHNQYAKEWLEKRLRDTIRRTMQAVMQADVALRFEIWQHDTDRVTAAAESPDANRAL